MYMFMNARKIAKRVCPTSPFSRPNCRSLSLQARTCCPGGTWSGTVGNIGNLSGWLLNAGCETEPRKQIELPETLDLNSLVTDEDEETIKVYGRDFVLHNKLASLIYDSEF